MFGSSKGKDAAFFDAFSAHAATSVEAGKMLVQMMTSLQSNDDGPCTPYIICDASSVGDPKIDEEMTTLAAKIKDCETAGDTITHDTMKRLRENWITPLDRADIHDLVSHLDDVLDFIEEAALRVVLFEVHLAAPQAKEIAEILVNACVTMAKAVDLLRDMKHAPQIRQLCIEINELENNADKVYQAAIAALFKTGNDPLFVMKWRDIFDSLESAVDRCEDVADVVQGVVLEYS